MRIVTIDFETYFDDAYTLKKLSTEAYIRDKRFEAHGAAIKWRPDEPARWYAERELQRVLAGHDWTQTAILCHHAQFDGLILSCRYDIRPRIWLDSLSMARLLLGNHLSVSLDNVRSHFGIPAKRTPYEKFKGRHWHELDDATQRELAEGCCDEVESIWTIFGKLAAKFPASQYAVIDCLVRMFVDPILVGDVDFMGRVWQAEYDRRRNLFDRLDVDASDLRSDAAFAGLLAAQGIEPQMKPGKPKDGQPRLIYAFAKTDPFMQDLLDSDDDIIASLAQARLDAESTIQMTRAETLGFMSTRGPLTVYAKAYGARTTRPSGGDRSNFLNMKKADPDLPRQDTNISLKGGICAPEGYLLAPVDASQIECRLLNTIAGQWDVIDTFRVKDDPYAKVASEFYGYAVNKRDHPTERQVGKVLELQSGYGSGGPKIAATLRNKAGIVLEPAQAEAARDAYRRTHPAVTRLWGEAGRMIARLAGGAPLDWGPVTLRDGCMWLPNGCPVIYDTLEYHDPRPEDGDGLPIDAGYWRVKTRRGWDKLYGAKLVENLCQALAWCLVSDVMVRLDKAGLRTLNAPYDELLLLIRQDGHEQEALDYAINEMRRPPEWLPEIPLDAEGHLQSRYE